MRLTHADRERGPVLKAPSDMEDAYPLAAAIRKSVRSAQATETMNRRKLPLQNVEGFECMAQFPVTPGGSSRGSNFGWNHEHARPYADGLFLLYRNDYSRLVNKRLNHLTDTKNLTDTSDVICPILISNKI